MNSKKRCIVCAGSEEENVTYHRFPKNVAVRKTWLEALQLEMDKISDYSVVCSGHFNIRMQTCVRTRLPPGAIPRIITATTASSSINDPAYRRYEVGTSPGERCTFSADSSALEGERYTESQPGSR